MTAKGSDGSMEQEPTPPAHVVEALRLLNEALEADPAAVHALLAHHVVCKEGVALCDTVRIRGDVTTHSASPLGLVWACVGRIPSGERKGFPWVDVETDTHFRPVRFVLGTVPSPSGVRYMDADPPKAVSP